MVSQVASPTDGTPYIAWGDHQAVHLAMGPHKLARSNFTGSIIASVILILLVPYL
jgi:hypothetical protein